MTVQEEARRSPRERLLDAAEELFYAEGVHTTGIDRVIERAGVAKASLYSCFGSKEGLISAYLDEQHRKLIGRRRAAAQAAPDPKSAILAVFDSLARDFERPDYNGCPFSRASAEETDSSMIVAASHAYRDDLRALLRDLCAQAGAADPDRLALQLHLLYSGGSDSVKLDREPGIATAQRAAVEALLAGIPHGA